MADRIENERTLRREMRLPPARQAERLVRQAVSRGTTHIRTHVDVDTDVKLANFEGVLEAALRGGAELVGGIDPASIDRDPAG